MKTWAVVLALVAVGCVTAESHPADPNERGGDSMGAIVSDAGTVAVDAGAADATPTETQPPVDCVNAYPLFYTITKCSLPTVGICEWGAADGRHGPSQYGCLVQGSLCVAACP